MSQFHFVILIHTYIGFFPIRHKKKLIMHIFILFIQGFHLDDQQAAGAFVLMYRSRSKTIHFQERERTRLLVYEINQKNSANDMEGNDCKSVYSHNITVSA